MLGPEQKSSRSLLACSERDSTEIRRRLSAVIVLSRTVACFDECEYRIMTNLSTCMAGARSDADPNIIASARAHGSRSTCKRTTTRLSPIRPNPMKIMYLKPHGSRFTRPVGCLKVEDMSPDGDLPVTFSFFAPGHTFMIKDLGELS